MKVLGQDLRVGDMWTNCDCVFLVLKVEKVLHEDNIMYRVTYLETSECGKISRHTMGLYYDSNISSPEFVRLESS
jgi:hypothetical protein